MLLLSRVVGRASAIELGTGYCPGQNPVIARAAIRFKMSAMA